MQQEERKTIRPLYHQMVKANVHGVDGATTSATCMNFTSVHFDVPLSAVVVFYFNYSLYFSENHQSGNIKCFFQRRSSKPQRTWKLELNKIKKQLLNAR